MDDLIEKAAEILVACGYAERLGEHGKRKKYVSEGKIHLIGMTSCPFTDTLEGRRQADAIEDWLLDNHIWLYEGSECKATDNSKPKSEHKWRLGRIKWCLEELSK